MKIIFCLSYILVPITTTIIADSEDDFLIITSNKELWKFLTKLYPEHKVHYLFPTPTLSKNLFRNANNFVLLLKYKRYLKKKYRHIENAEIFFFSLAFCELEAWLVKYLSNKNKVFEQTEISKNHLTPDYSFLSFLSKLLRKALFSVDFDPYRLGVSTQFCVSENFYKTIHATRSRIQTDYNISYETIINQFDELKCSKILITCGNVADRFVKKKEYIQKMDLVIDCLMNTFSHNAIAIKAHPRFPYYYSKENLLKQIPNYIAANLILKHFEIVIGYNSRLLHEAAQNGKTAISLLYIMTPIDVENQYSFIKYLKDGTDNGVLFPNSVAELYQLFEENI